MTLFARKLGGSVLGLGLLLTGTPAGAQVSPPEPAFPLPNVLDYARLDAFMLKASHNSYQRNPSYDEQLHQDNCWGLEFDIVWNSDNNTPSIKHYCGAVDNQHTSEFGSTMQALLVRPEMHERLTIIWFEPKLDTGTLFECTQPPTNLVPHWSATSGQAKQFVQVMLDKMIDRTNTTDGSDGRIRQREIFTPDLLDKNIYKWPSVRQLVDNGYHFIIVMQKAGLNNVVFDIGGNEADYFGGNEYNRLFVNREEGGRPSGETPRPGDRFLWRSYPNLDDLSGWNKAIARGFNVISTNDVGEGHTFNSPTLPSWPLYVNSSAASNSDQWGTLLKPFPTLEDAMDRLLKIRTALAIPSEMPNGQSGRSDTLPLGMEPHDVALSPSNYILPAARRVLNVPMRLKRKSGTTGTVIIR